MKKNRQVEKQQAEEAKIPIQPFRKSRRIKKNQQKSANFEEQQNSGFKATKKQKVEVQYFKQLHLNQVRYSIGDSVLIRLESEEDDESMGKIIEIFKDKYPKVRIQWYYKPQDIWKTSIPNYIGAGEIFLSTHEQDVYCECIYGKVEVMDFEDYFVKDEVEDDIYYYRAKYDFTTKQFMPPKEQ